MRPLPISRSAIAAESPALKRYLSEVSKIPLITAAEEIALAQRIRKGDAAAVDLLVRANLRFVVSIAKQYQNNYLPLMDLISEGNIGLVEAAQRFDETKGFKFISYAVWWIRKSILAAISEHSRLIRLPLTKITALRELQEAIAQLEQQLEREPTVEELAEATERSTSEIQMILQTGARHQYLHAPLEPEESRNYLDLIAQQEIPQPDEELLEAERRQAEVARLLAPLKPRERRILRLYFGFGELETGIAGNDADFGAVSFEGIGRQLGLSAERVRQLKHRALLKLQVSSR